MSSNQVAITCKNCGYPTSDMYCSRCGQRSDVDRLTLKRIMQYLRTDAFYEKNKAIYTTAQLLLRPGHTLREYLEGKRVRFTRPVAYVMLIAGFYGALHYFSGVPLVGDGEALRKLLPKLSIRTMNLWVSTHYAWIALLSILLLSVSSWLVFQKAGYNFLEHLVLNAYLTGQRFVIEIILFPLVYLSVKSGRLELSKLCVLLVAQLFNAFSLMQFFNRQSRVKSLLLFLAMYMVFTMQIALIILLLELLR